MTAILPHGGNLFQEKVPAAVHVGNGFGKAAGFLQVEELGVLETPIVLTNTLAVGTALDAVVGWTLARPGNEAVRSVTFNLQLPSTSYREWTAVSRFYARLVESLGAAPGIRGAAATAFGRSSTPNATRSMPSACAGRRDRAGRSAVARASTAAASHTTANRTSRQIRPTKK